MRNVEEEQEVMEEVTEKETAEEGQLEDQDEGAVGELECSSSKMRYTKKDRVFVYLVYPTGSLCDCNKENVASKPPCDCEFTYKQVVYSSVQQMHENLQSGVGYTCKQCKHHVVGEKLNGSISDDNDDNENFSLIDDSNTKGSENCSLVDESNMEERDLKEVVNRT